MTRNPSTATAGAADAAEKTILGHADHEDTKDTAFAACKSLALGTLAVDCRTSANCGWSAAQTAPVLATPAELY
jgi:hypothetical protein